MEKTVTVQAIGMAWYRESEYLRFRSLFADGHKLHPTFLQWKKDAEKGHKSFIRQGFIVIKVDIDPDTFPTWCTINGYDVDADGRNAFATAEATRILRENGHLFA